MSDRRTGSFESIIGVLQHRNYRRFVFIYVGTSFVAASSTFATLPKVSEWKCNLCRNVASATEDQIRTHCQDFHKGCDKRYKCCLCSFARDTTAEITAHLRSCHDFVSQVVVPIYREVSRRQRSEISSIDSRVSNDDEVIDVDVVRQRRSIY